ncbi:type IV pilin protein [Dyella sp. 20L07]|uniref:type IV pilin protein n=1 Tax=Dyella sp. 20L07 TaxID=3384240 RepID=UPI003D2DED31
MYVLSPPRSEDSTRRRATGHSQALNVFRVPYPPGKDSSAPAQKQAGFTLIELLIVIVIIAILAAIALPSYSDYLTRSKLTDAMNGLSGFRVSMEQNFQDNRAYICPGSTNGPANPQFTYFTFTCTLTTDANGNAGYTGQAAGNTGSPVSGFTYQIDNLNNRTTTAVPTGWGTAPVTCWVVRKGGGCQ